MLKKILLCLGLCLGLSIGSLGYAPIYFSNTVVSGETGGGQPSQIQYIDANHCLQGASGATYEASTGITYATLMTVTAPSSAHAYKDAIQTIQKNIETKILLSAEAWDDNAEFSGSRFTAKRDGTYLALGNLTTINQPDGAITTVALKKGTNIFTQNSSGQGVVNANEVLNVSGIIKLAIGDYIEMFGTSTVTADVYSNDSYTDLSVVRIY